MNLGGNSNESNSRSATGLRGTKFQPEQEERSNRSAQLSEDWTRQVMRAPQMFRGQTAEQINPSGRFGLGLNADRAVSELGTQLYGKASASGARQGRLTPEGASVAAGDAMTHALPQLIPQLQAFQQWQFEQPVNLNKFAGQSVGQNSQIQVMNMGQEGRTDASGFGFEFGILSG